MTRNLILLTILLAGCDHANAITAPTEVATTRETPATRPTPTIGWSLERSGEHPGVAVTPDVATQSIVIQSPDGAFVAWANPGQHIELPAWGWYWVKGFTYAWSDNFAFEVVENGNYSGAAAAPTPVTPAATWGQEVCSPDGFVFWGGRSVVLAVQAKTAIRVRYSDPYHTTTYQRGQLEMVRVDEAGVTTADLPDDKTEATQEFALAAPITQATVVSVAGSLYRVCVRGRS
jgi:hypothetical protein